MKVTEILVVYAEIEIAVRLSRGLQHVFGEQVWIETCRSAETALYALYLKDFDLLIADQNLPGSLGTKLIEEAQLISPNLKTVLITEASENILDARDSKDVTLFIAKPFKLARFVPLIQALLK